MKLGLHKRRRSGDGVSSSHADLSATPFALLAGEIEGVKTSQAGSGTKKTMLVGGDTIELGKILGTGSDVASEDFEVVAQGDDENLLADGAHFDFKD